MDIAGVEEHNRFKADFVLEGGAFHSDGEGTILVTEECLLHPNRNAHLNKADIEQNLKDYLGAEKVVWIPRGLAADEVGRMIDSIILPLLFLFYVTSACALCIAAP